MPTDIDWAPADSHADAFEDEYVRIQDHGGPKSRYQDAQKYNYNKIQSPGEAVYMIRHNGEQYERTIPNKQEEKEMTIRKNGIIIYADKNNVVYEASINRFTDEIKSELQHYELQKLTVDSSDCIDDFSIIAKINSLTSLCIRTDYKTIEISFANEMKNLKYLGIGKFTGVLTNKNLVQIGYIWHKKSDISQCSNIESVSISNCADTKTFISQIAQLKKLCKLDFFRISISSFSKSDEGTTVEELEFSYCPKLEDLEELPSNFPNVTKLKFDHCKNIQDYSHLAKLKTLEELVILESAPITDLSFLKELPKLSLLRILKTKITASNVEILDEIPAKVDLLFTGIK